MMSFEKKRKIIEKKFLQIQSSRNEGQRPDIFCLGCKEVEKVHSPDL
jgi:hypothetical protein